MSLFSVQGRGSSSSTLLPSVCLFRLSDLGRVGPEPRFPLRTEPLGLETVGSRPVDAALASYCKL